MLSITYLSEIVAAASAGLALIALIVAAVLAMKLRRLRAEQLVVLGGHERRDLVAHGERVERGFGELREYVEESLMRLDERLTEDERRLDGAITYRALVRYDAYNEMSGHQSSSIALLDARRSGIVMSSILHRDQARIYVRQVHEGEAELELSPEEREAIELALEAGSTARSG